MNDLQQLISELTSGSVYIRTHNFPDPDAIASAYGLQYLLSHFGIASTICFSGRIDRYNTQKMIDLLDVSFVAFEDLPALSDQDHLIYIDAQYANANVQDTPQPCKMHCIDHHPVYEHSDYIFADIRPEYGACCTIIGQYFLENNVPFSAKTATALIYGLKIDTANLSRGVSQADLDIFYQLYTTCNQDLLQSLEHNTLLVEDLAAYGTAIDTLDIRGDYCFADAGSNCQEALIATICDFLVSLATVDMAVVYSVKKDGIKISVRSCSSKYHSGVICNTALDKIGNGGGHHRMAGGFVPIDCSNTDKESCITMLKKRFENAL